MQCHVGEIPRRTSSSLYDGIIKLNFLIKFRQFKRIDLKTLVLRIRMLD